MSYGTVGGIWTNEGGGIPAEKLNRPRFKSDSEIYGSNIKAAIKSGDHNRAFDLIWVCPCLSNKRKTELCKKYFPYLFCCD